MEIFISVTILKIKIDYKAQNDYIYTVSTLFMKNKINILLLNVIITNIVVTRLCLSVV
jgi:hypothetical protein